MHSSRVVQDAQEAKKGKKKKRKGKKGEDKGQEEEASAAGAAERSSSQDSRNYASAWSAAITKESSPEAQAASKPTGERGQALLHSAEEAKVDSVDTSGADSKAAANNHSINRRGAHGDASMMVRDDVQAVPTPVRGTAAGESKKGVPSPARSQVKSAAGKAGQNAPADCGRVKGEWVPLPGQSNPFKQSIDWQAAGGRKAKRQTAGNAGGNASLQQAPDTLAARQARLPRPQNAGKGAQGEPRGTAPARTSNALAKASVTSAQSNARQEQAGSWGMKSKADTAKAAKAVPAPGKHSSPSKSSREPAALPEQPGRGKKLDDSIACSALPVSFADMARPAKGLQAAPAAQPLPPEAPSAVVPAQRGRSGPSSGAVARPVQYGHSPEAAALASAYGLSPAAATAPVVSMKGPATLPWLAAAAQPTQQPQREPSDICPAQLVSSAGLPGGLRGMSCPVSSWPVRVGTGLHGSTVWLFVASGQHAPVHKYTFAESHLQCKFLFQVAIQKQIR